MLKKAFGSNLDYPIRKQSQNSVKISGYTRKL